MGSASRKRRRFIQICMNDIDERAERIFFYAACSCVSQNGTLFNFGREKTNSIIDGVLLLQRIFYQQKLNQSSIVYRFNGGGGLFMDESKSGSSKKN